MQTKSINPPRRTTRRVGPEKELLLEVNRHHGPLTSIDRMSLVNMGEIPWDDGHSNKECDEQHAGVTHDAYMAARHQEVNDRLRRQHAENIGRYTPPTKPISEPQANLIVRLLRELEGIDTDTHATAKAWYEERADTMSGKTATDLIKRLKHHCGYEEDGWKKRADFVPPKPAPAKPKVEKEGLYRLDGHLYQVVRTKDNPPRLYAKLVTFVEDKKRPTLTYAPGIIRRLTPEDIVPMDEANELTQRTGWCVFGHFLTNPVSIARGMGPKCWERYGH